MDEVTAWRPDKPLAAGWSNQAEADERGEVGRSERGAGKTLRFHAHGGLRTRN